MKRIRNEISSFGDSDTFKKTRTYAIQQVQKTADAMKEKIEEKLREITDTTSEEYKTYTELLTQLAEETKKKLAEVGESFENEITKTLSDQVDFIQDKISNISVDIDVSDNKEAIAGEGLSALGGGIKGIADFFNPKENNKELIDKYEKSINELQGKLTKEEELERNHSDILAQLQIERQNMLLELQRASTDEKRELLKAELAINKDKLNKEYEQIREHHNNVTNLQKDLEGTQTKKTAEEQKSKVKLWGAGFKTIGGLFKTFGTMMGMEGKKQFKVMQALKIGEAVVMGYYAAVAAWGQGMKDGGLPLAIAYTAASLIQTAGLIASIASARPGSSNQSSSAGASVPTPSVTPETPETPVSETITRQDINIHIYGNVVDQDKFARELIPSITKAISDGETL
jgi:hypothetical protein